MNENRSDGNLPSFFQVAKVSWGLRRFVAAGLTVRLHGLPEKRGTDLSNGSCSRSYRSGRSRTNGVVVVDARSTGRPGRRAEAKRSEGQLSRRERSPGRWKALLIISTVASVTGRRWRVILAARSQMPLASGEGVSSSRRKPRTRKRAIRRVGGAR